MVQSYFGKTNCNG